jgi:hypothetical protein
VRFFGLLAIASLFLFVAACGGDSDDSSETEAAAPADDPPGESATAEQAPIEAATEAAAPEPETDTEESDGGAPQPATGGGNATVTLANGTNYEFSILCALEPQMAAGSEILYTAVSYDDPGLDVTQFGEAGPITDLGVITIYDGSFETLWEASTLLEALGGTFDLSLDGSIISGGGTFYAGGDPSGEIVNGELTANC